ncbi:DNA cytosine methyltransferase [Streptomyces sp. NBC_00464]|uniref:DNA cytosine methyltransferase n=1 Tax=unclassified Streptomyces TaxID=2593676 RepID=UPI002E13D7DA|nr:MULTISPECIES: DNA (cytosine-5-)-methyltransferase [unclassified Streptomyces]WSI61531.1 DNA cytosine methyltransferase [Streptomyces sp. NBC_01336]
MSAVEPEKPLKVIEICAGAGGQTLGLERAGFRHRLAIELDDKAAETLRRNLVEFLGYSEEEARDSVKVGDVADPAVWNPVVDAEDLDLLAGGVPCPPFSIAGKQLGSSDERDLFAWAVELCGKVRPKALLLENVRGLSANRFAGYRQHVLDRLKDSGYIAEWQLLQADDFGVSQLRPRFVLVALQEEFAPYFVWPERKPGSAKSVGELLVDLMAKNGWSGAHEWAENASGIAPTIVGGSKKHGGADLGPTRAKRAWAQKGVDAMGVADQAPSADGPPVIEGSPRPKLTTAMVARIQGWQDADSEVNADEDDFRWRFHGRKTSVYRQIGNAFPPPVAKALGDSIRNALNKVGEPHDLVETADVVTDPVYKLLRSSTRALSVDQIIAKLAAAGTAMDQPTVERHLNHLKHDFEMTTVTRSNGAAAYSIGEFKAFVGQDDHQRHDLFTQHRSKIS